MVKLAYSGGGELIVVSETEEKLEKTIRELKLPFIKSKIRKTQDEED